MPFYTYLVASQRNGRLYCGHTDEIGDRISQHKAKTFKGFTAKYGVNILVWYEVHEERAAAFHRERRIKKWIRTWKIRMLEERNPQWLDLYETLNQ
jgi:putative endonuclease